MTLNDQFAFPFYDLVNEPLERPTSEGKRRSMIRDEVTPLREKIKMLFDQLNTALEATSPSQLPLVHSPADAANLVMYPMSALEKEELWTLLLNTRNCVFAVCRIYAGSLNSSQVRVGEVFTPAVRRLAANIIVIHNHPSGDPTPSAEDIAITRAIVQAGKLLDIEVLDHLVIGQGRYVSLKERGLGF